MREDFKQSFCKICNEQTNHYKDIYNGKWRCLKCIEDTIKKNRMPTETFVKIFDEVIAENKKQK